MKYLSVILGLFFLASCSKEVTLDIPPFVEKIAVDGRIETGLPPIVILSKTQDIYGETDFSALANSFVNGALVTVSDGSNTITLTELCANSLTPQQLALVSGVLGIDVEAIQALNICAYVGLDPAFLGEVNKTYTLNIQVNGETFTSETSLLPVPVVDSLYFELEPGTNGQGFGWCMLNDNPSTYNAYFFQTRRISLNEEGEPKDPFFFKNTNSAFDDTFFNGLSFKFAFTNMGGRNDNDPDALSFMFKTNDTVVIKFSSLDFKAFKFLETKAIQQSSGASPFASPAYIPTNIEGGAIGGWIGYSPRFDTLICIP
jgi:hypothetical protein